jgi:hypothetical protein
MTNDVTIMNMNNEQIRIWKKADVAYFMKRLASKHSLGENEFNQDNGDPGRIRIWNLLVTNPERYFPTNLLGAGKRKLLVYIELGRRLTTHLFHFICGPSHDLGINQSEKGKHFLLLRRILI